MRKSGDAEAGDRTDRGNVCPHLGLEEDPSSCCHEPSPRHRCYLWMQRSRIDRSHQADFCLTDAHTICPWFSIGAPLSVRLESRTLPMRLAAGAAVAMLSAGAVALATVAWFSLRRVPATLGRLAVDLAAVIWRLMRRALASLGRLAGKLAVAFWRWLRLVIGRLVRFLRSRARLSLDETGQRITEARLQPAPQTQQAEQSAPPAAEDASKGNPEAAELVEQGLIARREGSRDVAYSLFVQATELDPSLGDGWLWRAALSRTAEEKRESLEQILRSNPTSSLGASAVALLEELRTATPPAAQPASGLVTATPTPNGGPDPQEAPSAGRPPWTQDRILWQCTACETINTGPLLGCRSCGYPSPQVEEELMSSGDAYMAEGLSGLKTGNEELAYGYFVMACKASPKSELAWHWRAKTAPTLDEVITCLQKIVEINPNSTRAKADLQSALQRREAEKARPEPRALSLPAGAARPWTALSRIAGELRWWLLQVAGLCTFAVALALTVPYVLRLAGPPSEPALREYFALLPGIGLPELTLQAPGLPALALATYLPLILGLLLLHAAFIVASGGGLGAGAG